MTVEKISTLKIEDAFKEVENRLLNEKCKIIGKNFPNSILVEHGSLINWSYSPKMILKKINLFLTQHREGTKIVGVTDFPTTVEGIVVSVLLIVLLFLGMIAKTIADIFSSQGLSPLATLYNAVAIISFITIPITIIFEVIFYIKRDEFVKELLKTLP